MTAAEKQHRFLVLIAFGLVYVFWGSTYLAIKVAVETIPPLVMAGVRFLIAGPLMLAWCAASGRSVRLTGRDLRHLIVIGLLLLSGGNVLLAWSEQYLPSGLASLIVAVVPIWVAVIEGFVLRKARLTGMGWAGLTLGIVGLGVLLWPKLNATGTLGEMELIACGIVLLGSLSWTCGSLSSRYLDLSIGPFAATGWEMTFAGIFNTGLALALGQEHKTLWSAKGFGAIVYLVVFGSWVGFTAYIWLLEHVPTPKVATYAYVNPVVAVLLGWAILHETVDAYIATGAIIIVAAVALVTSSKLRGEPARAAGRLPATEPGSD
jgi:drug/metabolite transporter (DMT)-like permease